MVLADHAHVFGSPKRTHRGGWVAQPEMAHCLGGLWGKRLELALCRRLAGIVGQVELGGQLADCHDDSAVLALRQALCDHNPQMSIPSAEGTFDMNLSFLDASSAGVVDVCDNLCCDFASW